MIVYTFQKDNSSSILESFLIGGRKAQWKWKTSQETDVQWIQKLLREQPPQVLEAHQVLYITEKGQSRITGKLLGPWEHQIGKINFEKWGNTFSSCTFLPCKAEQNQPLGCSKPQSEVLLALGIQSCTELAQGYKQPSQSPDFIQYNASQGKNHISYSLQLSAIPRIDILNMRNHKGKERQCCVQSGWRATKY